MHSNDTTEDRLRELLQDPGWALPSWPDAEARVRGAARRQRLRITGAAAGAGTAIAAIVISVPMLSSPAPGTLTGALPGSSAATA